MAANFDDSNIVRPGHRWESVGQMTSSPAELQGCQLVRARVVNWLNTFELPIKDNHRPQSSKQF